MHRSARDDLDENDLIHMDPDHESFAPFEINFFEVFFKENLKNQSSLDD